MPNNFLQIPSVSEIMKQFPMILSSLNKDHIKAFRKLIEWSMTQGRWAGEWFEG